MILDSINNAYRIMRERKWDTLYWAIDLHGVCLKSTYVSSQHEWISADAIAGLQAIATQPENKIILWSAVHETEKQAIIDKFSEKGIKITGFNRNPEVFNTSTSNFNEKFYFNVLLDDKAGFDYMTDWNAIIRFYAIKHANRILDTMN